ncbi:MAG: SDR family oxidoreductase [Chloracidobacterium sp.]|nr:SDR family oxidoreductase [Chloracidobacterium sp.]
MRVLIFGASGMLGHKLYQQLSTDFEVFATIRLGFDSISKFGFFDRKSIVENINVLDIESIRSAIENTKPDIVINAVGVVKQLPASEDVINTLSVNSVCPKRLAVLSSEYHFRLITLSTDCVFDGKKGNYVETDNPDANDLYGISKFLGEQTGDNCLTIRTSIIGRELTTGHSVVEWFLSNRGKNVTGYVNAIYSGFPTIVLAKIVSDIVTKHPELNGVYHVSSDPINKFELLGLLNKYYQANVVIEPFEDFVIDRSLNSLSFRKATDFSPLSWEKMIEQMAADPTPYDKWKK